MMNLANIMRPQSFADVKGQEKTIALIKSAIRKDKDINILLTGPAGTGKTTIARIVAKKYNCQNEHDGEPCNECENCRAIMEGKSLDVVELDAASHNGVEDVRDLIASTQYAPVGEKKVYILDEVHMFSTGAWNALLKTLEEPPKNCIFILCTTEKHKVPATIISRCREFTLESIPTETIYKQLVDVCNKYEKAYEDDALKLIAKEANGCMREALSLLESFMDVDGLATANVASVFGTSDEDSVFDILEGICTGDVKRAVSGFDASLSKGTKMSLLVKALIEAITDMMYVLQGVSIDSLFRTDSYKKNLLHLGNVCDMPKLMELTHQFSEVYSSIGTSSDTFFFVKSAILRAIYYNSEIELLKKRVDELENRPITTVEKVTVSSDNSLSDGFKSIHADIEVTDDAVDEPNVATKTESTADDTDVKGFDDISTDIPDQLYDYDDSNNNIIPFEATVPFEVLDSMSDKQTDEQQESRQNMTDAGTELPSGMEISDEVIDMSEPADKTSDATEKESDVKEHDPESSYELPSGMEISDEVINMSDDTDNSDVFSSSDLHDKESTSESYELPSGMEISDEVIDMSDDTDNKDEKAGETKPASDDEPDVFNFDFSGWL